jgi:Zn-dependent protease with chaperone function
MLKPRVQMSMKPGRGGGRPLFPWAARPLCWKARFCKTLAVFFVHTHQWIDQFLERLGCESVGETSLELIREELEQLELDETTGPMIAAEDAPALFRMLRKVAKQMRCRPLREVRLSFLPACGITELVVRPDVSRPVLVVGLPVLHIWSVEELEAVLAHEIAHLRHRDIEFQRTVLGWAGALRQKLGKSDPATADCWRRRWAQTSLHWVEYFARPVAREMEFRADHCSAETIGSEELASALENLAVVQPIFHELLSRTEKVASPNVYRDFARTWRTLKGPTFRLLRQKLVASASHESSDWHPPLGQRIDRLRRSGRSARLSAHPSLHLLDDPARLEQILHNHLFRSSSETPTTFRRAQGS